MSETDPEFPEQVRMDRTQIDANGSQMTSNDPVSTLQEVVSSMSLDENSRTPSTGQHQSLSMSDTSLDWAEQMQQDSDERHRMASG